MAIDRNVKLILDFLREWSQLPKYSLERRIDVWLAPYLPRFLEDTLGGRFQLVMAEFPIKKPKNAQSVNADFLLHRQADPGRPGDRGAWILLELKTDGSSIDGRQLRRYMDAARNGAGRRAPMERMLDGIARIAARTEPLHASAYRRIHWRVRHAGDVRAPVQVWYVAPMVPDLRRSGFRAFGLRQLAHWKPAGQDPVWRQLQKVLRAAASSRKARRRARSK